MSAIERAVVAELRAAGYPVLTRRQWGSKHLGVYQLRRATRRFVGPADHLFAHISVTHPGTDPREAMQTLERIGYERFRTGVSYNWALHRPSKTILLGMPHDAAGAHTLNDKEVAGFPANLNYWGHAIAQIGMPGDSFDDWMRDAAAAVIAAEKKHGAAKPGARLHSHSRFAWKDCACDPYRDRIPDVERAAATALTARRTPATIPESQEDDMPFSEAELRQIVREESGNGVWAKKLGARSERADLILIRAKDRSVQAATRNVDVDEVATAVAARLPQGSPSAPEIAAALIDQLSKE